MKSVLPCLLLLVLALETVWASAAPREHQAYFKPFIWKSEPPSNCPFPASREIRGLLFTGVHSDYHFADTWYPTWAADGNLYSPFTDGDVYGEGANSDGFSFANDQDRQTLNYSKRRATTGQAVLMGDDPLNLTIKSLGTVAADPDPYEAVIADNEKAHAASGHWGVPTFVFENEPFFGQDRIDLLIWRMESRGLTRRS
jgi:hypothetical protein